MDRRIENAVGIIQGELHRNLRVLELARRVHLSPWHFIRLFKAETSYSPKQYVRQVKMKQAEELLSESFLSVKEIAANLGFEDRSQFSRYFKRFCGCAPTEFRARGERTLLIATLATEKQHAPLIESCSSLASNLVFSSPTSQRDRIERCGSAFRRAWLEKQTASVLFSKKPAAHAGPDFRGRERRRGHRL